MMLLLRGSSVSVMTGQFARKEFTMRTRKTGGTRKALLLYGSITGTLLLLLYILLRIFALFFSNQCILILSRIFYFPLDYSYFVIGLTLSILSALLAGLLYYLMGRKATGRTSSISRSMRTALWSICLFLALSLGIDFLFLFGAPQMQFGGVSVLDIMLHALIRLLLCVGFGLLMTYVGGRQIERTLRLPTL